MSVPLPSGAFSNDCPLAFVRTAELVFTASPKIAIWTNYFNFLTQASLVDISNNDNNDHTQIQSLFEKTTEFVVNKLPEIWYEIFCLHKSSAATTFVNQITVSHRSYSNVYNFFSYHLENFNVAFSPTLYADVISQSLVDALVQFQDTTMLNFIMCQLPASAVKLITGFLISRSHQEEFIKSVTNQLEADVCLELTTKVLQHIIAALMPIQRSSSSRARLASIEATGADSESSNNWSQMSDWFRFLKLLIHQSLRLHETDDKPVVVDNSTIPILGQLVDLLIVRNKSLPLVVTPLFGAVGTSASVNIVEELLACFPTPCYRSITLHIVRLWGDRTVVCSGNRLVIQLLTSVLLCTISILTAEDLTAVEDQDDVPLVVYFTKGVAVYLDMGDINIRKMGMSLAVIFSGKLGYTELHFAELDGETEESMMSVAASASGDSSDNRDHREAPGTGSTSATTAQSHSHPGLGLLEGDDIGYTSDSSDSDASLSDLEPLDRNSDEHDTGDGTFAADFVDCFSNPDISIRVSEDDKANMTPYLRECLEMLRVADTDKTAYQSHRSALLSVTWIIAGDNGLSWTSCTAPTPSDLGDLGAVLVRELLRLGNHFNMEHFECMRSDAVLSLLVMAPTIVVPVVTWSICDADSVSTGSKIDILSILVQSAYMLSHLQSVYEVQYPPGKASSSQSSVIGKDVGNDVQPTDPLDATAATVTKTRIKRPAKLRQLQDSNRIRYFRNDFGPVAHLFFGPIAAKIVNVKNESSGDGAGDSPGVLLTAQHVVSNSSGDMCVPPVNAFEFDGMSVLLPSQLLMALGDCVRCSVNTSIHPTLMINTIRICDGYKSSVALALRRSCLYSLHAVVECWMQYHRQVAGSGTSYGSGDGDALSVLTNIHGTRSSSSQEGSRLFLNVIIKLVDWCISSMSDDQDDQCRLFKIGIVRLAQQALAHLQP